MSSPRITWDREADALYIQLSDGEVSATLALSATVYIDVDADGNAVGMEVLRAGTGVLGDLPDIPDSATLREIIERAA